MKNVIIVFFAVCFAISVSFIYKIQKKQPLQHFPVSNVSQKQKIENPLYLLLFFSSKNCKDCMGAIDTLNHLNAPFVVYGIVPPEELAKERKLREVTGAGFELLPDERFRRYAPLYAPTLMGISKKGRILFILPGVPNQEKHLENFLYTFYSKAYVVLMH